MPTKYRDDEDEGDEAFLDDREAPDESDADDEDEEDGESDTVPCPYCRRPISELADLCPHCGSFVSAEDAPRHRRWWVIVAAVACLAAIVLVWVL